MNSQTLFEHLSKDCPFLAERDHTLGISSPLLVRLFLEFEWLLFDEHEWR
jgi:hypothetical protein